MEYLPLYTKEQYRRHEVRPGITGWAQVNGRNAISWDDKFKLDVWYVDNRSFGLDLKILLLTVTPSISEAAIVRLVKNSRARGLVLLAYGAGNVPFANPTVVRVAQEADARGMVVVVQTQVRRGSVELGVYYTSGPLSQFGVSAGDMTVEATVAKLKYLLGRQMWSKNDIKVLMQRSLRGELTESAIASNLRPRL